MAEIDLKKLLPYRRPSENASVRLFCLSFAGGAAAVYREWTALLPSSVDVCAIELPGHGMRLRDPPVGEMDRLADELVAALRPLCDRPLVLFGHSLGARIAFAFARRVPQIAGLIASGSNAPHLPPRRHRAELPRPALIRALAELGGTPPQVLKDAELLDIFLPSIRADFRLLERGLAAEDTRLSCPILALAARDDGEVPFEDAAAWTSRTTADFQLIEMTGGHFFLQARRDAVLSAVRDALSVWTPPL